MNRQKCVEFAVEHLSECASELLEWSSTSLLRDGKLRELSEMCRAWGCGAEALSVAESIVQKVALEAAAKAAPKPANSVTSPRQSP